MSRIREVVLLFNYTRLHVVESCRESASEREARGSYTYWDSKITSCSHKQLSGSSPPRLGQHHHFWLQHQRLEYWWRAIHRKNTTALLSSKSSGILPSLIILRCQQFLFCIHETTLTVSILLTWIAHLPKALPIGTPKEAEAEAIEDDYAEDGDSFAALRSKATAAGKRWGNANSFAISLLTRYLMPLFQGRNQTYATIP